MGNRGKIGLAVGLFVLALALFFWLRPTVEIPAESADERTHWICAACGTAFDLPPDEPQGTFSAVTISGADGESGEVQPGGARRGGVGYVRVAKCPSCAQFEGRAAIVCASCGEVFRQQKDDGTAMICPKCNWDPTTNAPAEGERLDVLENP